MPTHIYLVRHGETVWNTEGRFQGHMDIELNEAGIGQAGRLANFLLNHRIDAIYASDLKRARATAKALADVKKIDVGIYEDLRERSYGQLEGLTRDEILARYPDLDLSGVLGGQYGVETLEAVKDRITRVMSNLARAHPDEQLCIVSHGGVINAFLHEISGGEYGTGVTKISNTGITHLAYDETEGWNIYTVNGIEHLEG